MQFSILLYLLYNIYFHIKSLKLSEAWSNTIGFLLWVLVHSIKIILVNNHCTNFYRKVRLYFFLCYIKKI